MLPKIAVKKDLTVNGRTYPIIEAGEGATGRLSPRFPG